MTRCLFASDLHGSPRRYAALLDAIARDQPDAVFLGGDLLPGGAALASAHTGSDFIAGYLAGELELLRSRLGPRYPRFVAILGNDDPRSAEPALRDLATRGLLEYLDGSRAVAVGEHTVYGYPYVPPTPFLLKDWERYDVSRYVEPGCVSPEEGLRSVPADASTTRYRTIARDLAELAAEADLNRAVFLFHAPPHATALDRAALDDVMVDHVALDVHVGSIAIRRFIEQQQPLLTMHGHIHESARLTGSWRDRIGRTVMLSAAHDGPELALVRCDLAAPDAATRSLL